MKEFQSQTSVRSDWGGGGGPDPRTLPLDPPLDMPFDEKMIDMNFLFFFKCAFHYEQDARVGELGFLYVYIDRVGKCQLSNYCTTAHVNFDDVRFFFVMKVIQSVVC